MYKLAENKTNLLSSNTCTGYVSQTFLCATQTGSENKLQVILKSIHLSKLPKFNVKFTFLFEV